jgi:putative acetyltransferase
MFTIRKYLEKDAQETWQLFFNTVRNINSQDYSIQQLQAWAPDSMDPFIWNKRMSDVLPFIAEVDGIIVGYADLQNDGLIDHFFCHYNYQRQGVGRALMLHILHEGKKRGIKHYFSQVSITARPFFEHFGFKCVKQQLLEVRGEELINFVMEKRDDYIAPLI